MSTELVVALDYSNPSQAEALMTELEGFPVIYKVGLELFLGAGAPWVQALSSAGKRIFLDLKFHDIPNTVAQAVAQASKTGAEFLTVHLSGGKMMLDAVELRQVQAITKMEIFERPKILGVSVLTSFQEEDWIANVSHMAKVGQIRSISDSVLHFASLASQHPAVQGIVCSPKEVEMVRIKYPNLYLMVPGIRPEGSPSQDQARVTTPLEARRLGASAIVVGRPITQAPNPREVVESILKDIS